MRFPKLGSGVENAIWLTARTDVMQQVIIFGAADCGR
jgi:hypothetical protein